MTSIKIHDVDTGEVIEREMTPEELTRLETVRADSAQQTAQEAAVAAAKTTLLQKLGITEDEAKLLLS